MTSRGEQRCLRCDRVMVGHWAKLICRDCKVKTRRRRPKEVR